MTGLSLRRRVGLVPGPFPLGREVLTRVGKRVEHATTGTVGARHAVPLPWMPSAWALAGNQCRPRSAAAAGDG